MIEKCIACIVAYFSGNDTSGNLTCISTSAVKECVPKGAIPGIDFVFKE